SDGNSPISNLVHDAIGNLYGTTSEGGLGTGTIFKLSPIGGGQWTETVVHAFQGPPDGGFSYNGMVVDPSGNFYGATVHGGEADEDHRAIATGVAADVDIKIGFPVIERPNVAGLIDHDIR